MDRVGAARLRFVALVLVGMLSSSVLSRTATADCISDCQAEVYCDPLNQSECTRKRGECYAERCPGSRRPPAPERARGAYGAIAYAAESGAYGIADPSADEASARRSALGHCGRYGRGCKIVETISNACAAIAQDTGGVMDWAVDRDRRKAATQAVQRCTAKSNTGPRCFVRLLRCYSE